MTRRLITAALRIFKNNLTLNGFVKYANVQWLEFSSLIKGFDTYTRDLENV